MLPSREIGFCFCRCFWQETHRHREQEAVETGSGLRCRTLANHRPFSSVGGKKPMTPGFGHHLCPSALPATVQLRCDWPYRMSSAALLHAFLNSQQLLSFTQAACGVATGRTTWQLPLRLGLLDAAAMKLGPGYRLGYVTEARLAPCLPVSWSSSISFLTAMSSSLTSMRQIRPAGPRAEEDR